MLVLEKSIHSFVLQACPLGSEPDQNWQFTDFISSLPICPSFCSHYSLTSGQPTATRLLVLGIVRRVDRTKEKLDEPHLGGEVDSTATLTSNLVLLNLVRTRAVDDGTKERVVVEFLEVLLSLEVVTDLSELVRSGVGTVTSALELGIGTLDDGLDVAGSLTGGTTVGQDDDKERLLKLTGASGAEQQGVENLVVQASTEGSETCRLDNPHGEKLTRELDLADEVESGLLRVDPVALDAVVEEADLNTVLVEKRGGVSDAGKNAEG